MNELVHYFALTMMGLTVLWFSFAPGHKERRGLPIVAATRPKPRRHYGEYGLGSTSAPFRR
jgi:hypothetical protein